MGRGQTGLSGLGYVRPGPGSASLRSGGELCEPLPFTGRATPQPPLDTSWWGKNAGQQGWVAAGPAGGSTEALQTARVRPHEPVQCTLDTVTPDWRPQVAGRSGRTVRGRGPALAERPAGLAHLTAGTPGEWGGARAELREAVGPGASLRVSISNPEPRSIRRTGWRSRDDPTPLPACPLRRALPEAGPSLSTRRSHAGRPRPVPTSRRASHAAAAGGRGVVRDVASRFDSPPLFLARI